MEGNEVRLVGWYAKEVGGVSCDRCIAETMEPVLAELVALGYGWTDGIGALRS